MKKLIAGAVALTISGSAMAAASSVGFSFGTNFYAPSRSGFVAQNGQNFTISWMLDNDVSLGVYNELTGIANGAVVPATLSTLTVNAIQISKGVMKNVNVGLNLGSGTTTANATAPAVAAETNPVADIFGTVNILSGSGDKVSGSLAATVSARFIKNTGAVSNLNGTNIGLSVGIMF
jgi:hypothetical protein